MERRGKMWQESWFVPLWEMLVGSVLQGEVSGCAWRSTELGSFLPAGMEWVPRCCQAPLCVCAFPGELCTPLSLHTGTEDRAAAQGGILGPQRGK